MNNEKSTIAAIKEMVRPNKKPKTAVIPLDKVHPFKEHPNKVGNNEEMAELVESIRQNGVLNPVIVRPSKLLSDGYEIISGHRRCYAANEAGLKKVPAMVYEIDRDTAAVILVDSNIYCQNVLPECTAKRENICLQAETGCHQTSGKRFPTNCREVGKRRRLKPVIPSGYSNKQAEDFIIKACEHYRKYLRQRDAR